MNNTKRLTKILSFLMAILMLSSVVMLPASAATVPKAPTSISVARTTTSIKLSWPKVSGANGYRIYYKLPGDISWRTAVKSTTATSHTFNNLSWGKSYKFAVRSYAKSGSNTVWGGYKEVATATKTLIPKHFETRSRTTNALGLIWTDLYEADGYRIYYRTSPSADWKIAVSSTKSNMHTFKNLPAGKKYYFAVRGFVKTEFGTFFGDPRYLETATTPATPTLKASATSSSISLSWSKANGADGYRVYYKTGSSEWKTAVSSTTATSGTFKNLPANKTYTFAVKAYIKTPEKVVWSGYKQIKATTKTSSSTITGVPSTKAEIAAAYNKAVNDAKNYKGTVSLYKHDIINVSVPDSSTSSVINPVIKDLTATTPEMYTFKNGTDITEPNRKLFNTISPYGRQAAVNSKGLASASVTVNSNGGYTMTMKLITETSVFDGSINTSEPVYHMGAMDVLDFTALDLEPITITRGNFRYPGATIKATVDAQGRLISLTHELPINGTCIGKAGISITIDMSGSIDSVYRLTYK